MNNSPIILALDYSDLDEARKIVSLVRPNIGMIKIGLELFTAHGRDALALSGEFNIPVFLDLKLNDVPTTVAKTVEVICYQLAQYQGQHFLSIHCNGGMMMCREAMKRAEGSNVTIAAVSVLTSLDDRDFSEIGFRDSRPGIRTVDAAMIAADCLNDTWVYDNNRKRVVNGITTFICAPNQLNLMRQHLGDNITLITPGIRSDAEKTDDHARSKPASFALKNGANWLVIGRPITQAVDPLNASIHFMNQVQKFRP